MCIPRRGLGEETPAVGATSRMDCDALTGKGSKASACPSPLRGTKQPPAHQEVALHQAGTLPAPGPWLCSLARTWRPKGTRTARQAGARSWGWVGECWSSPPCTGCPSPVSEATAPGACPVTYVVQAPSCPSSGFLGLISPVKDLSQDPGTGGGAASGEPQLSHFHFPGEGRAGMPE